jgi:iron-sulfur cluster repair protein YtfE (RIC family)
MASNRISKDDIVNDIIRLYPNTIGVFNEFQIDSCCGGAASVEDSAIRDKADPEKLLARLNEVAGADS